MKRCILLLMICLTSVIQVRGSVIIESDQVSMSVVCPETVAVGDRFRIDYILTYPEQISPQDIDLSLKPSDEDEKVMFLYGPAVASSISITVNNSHQKLVQTKITWSFSFKARKEGVFVIPDFVLRSGSDTIKVKAIVKTIRFVTDKVEENVEAQGTANQAGANEVGSAAQPLLRIEIDKEKLQLGDSLICDVIFLSDVSQIDNVVLNRSFRVDHCYFEALKSDNGPSTEVIDNKTFNRWILCQYKIIPLKKGKFKIEPIQIRGVRQILHPNFNLFSGDLYSSVPFEVESNKLSFEVE